MRLLVITPLALLFTGCDLFDGQADNSFERNDRQQQDQTLNELPGNNNEGPLQLDRERGSKPPVARIEMACLGDTCDEVVFSAAGSTDATSYAWKLDGEDWGTDELLIVALYQDNDGDGVGDSDLFEVELTVSGANVGAGWGNGNGQGAENRNENANNHATDSKRLFVMTGPVPPLEPPDLPDPPPSLGVVVDFGNCGDTLTITNFAGCVQQGGDITQEVRKTSSLGVTTRGDLTYDWQNNQIASWGHAVAATWFTGSNPPREFATEPNTSPRIEDPYQYDSQFYPKSPAADGSLHLTAYYGLNTGEVLTARAHHFIGQPSASASDDLLTVDCTSGEPVISWARVNDS